jgi:hypothetical protein
MSEASLSSARLLAASARRNVPANVCRTTIWAATTGFPVRAKRLWCSQYCRRAIMIINEINGLSRSARVWRAI